MRNDALQAAIDELSELFSGRCETGRAVRASHANTLSFIAPQPPDVVVWVETSGEVASVLSIASRHGVPVIAFGAGTSLEGHVNAPSGGISIGLSRMTSIVRTSVEDLDCTVEAGVTRDQLNRHLRDTGLFFSVDPGAKEATLGGMAATGASGTNTVRYGTMSDNVLSLTAVMSDGRVVETGTRARKSSAGYDLTSLLIGSEGTLGIITGLTVRLHPVPEAVGVATVQFASLQAACAGALATTLAGAGVARVELVDGLTIAAVNAHAGMSLPTVPALFVEWHAMAATAPIAAAAIRDVLMEAGAISFDWSSSEKGRNQLWKARHEAFWAIRSAWPGKTPVVTDACVPVSRLAECISLTAADIEACGLIAPIVGHVGDGNFHTVVMIDALDAAEVLKVEGFLDRLSARAAAMDGTCSGEHGIGQGKKAALFRQAAGAVSVMSSIKKALDPRGILNPGKIF